MLLHAIINRPPQRGRPADHDNEQKRPQQIRLVALVMLGSLSATEAARVAGVHAATIWTWRRRLLLDGRTDTDGLRMIRDRSDKSLHRPHLPDGSS
jgi:transposase-like protein